jgi:hypothetical protein
MTDLGSGRPRTARGFDAAQSLAEIVDECLELGDRERFLQTFRAREAFPQK